MYCLKNIICGVTGVLLLSVSYAQDIGSVSGQKAFTLHGNFNAGLNYHTDLSDKNSSSPISFGPSPSYFLQFNPVLTIYGMALPFNLMFASQNKSFNTPFNRYGVSPYYKWVKLHLGWRSLHFSQFTLGGQQMLGAGFELTPGKFRAAFMYGKFNNAVTDISLYNNLNSNIPLYKRKGFAAKIGYGSAASFIEFSYLQAKDDSNSLKIGGALPLPPAANQVAGVKGQITFFKKLSLRADAAASYYTRNTASALVDVDNSFTKLAATNPNGSSRVAFAGEAALGYRFKAGNVELKYRRIDPNYQSMGAFYMQTDIEQYTAGFNLAFLHNKIHLRVHAGTQKNNLAKTAVNDSRRTIGNIALNISPSSVFGIDLNYSNYGISQQLIPKFTDPTAIVRYDSVRISQVNQSFTISPHLAINKANVQHLFNLQANLQSLRNSNAAQTNQDFTSTMGSFIYSLILPNKKINISNTLNYFNTVFTGNKSATIGYNLGITKSIDGFSKEHKSFIESVNLSLTGGYFSNRMNDEPAGNTISLSPTVGLVFLKKNSLRLSAVYVQTKNDNAPSEAVTKQMLLSANYAVSF
jgi:hypothetical protein